MAEVVTFNPEAKAEYFREKVAEGLPADKLFAGLVGNIAEGRDGLADFHMAELRALVSAYNEIESERLAKLFEEVSG
ncbi:hypothetical protein SAMN05216389_11116 [Oceanobacillus limi]|uniref:Uncharacterized protein n=1 Tax=Oceanobacillus limi TaxID=930131 RepID=A0A1I0EBK3_9BACI|nr:hypothetical protein [Oceanobacillus limi]SET42324.1 hypothetical protein SAMN05216389_11116 [Oceanobacillus limi]